MTNTERITTNNAELREAIEMAESLPDISNETLEITKNGMYNVLSYHLVDVNIPNILTQLLADTTFVNEELTRIDVDLFRGWQYITKISLPNVVSAPGLSGYLCYGCTKLKEVYMPKCTTFGNYSFYNNTALETIDFPSLVTIGTNGFRQCTSVTSVNLPACTTLNSYAFQKCEALTKLDFPKVNWLGA